MCLYREICAQGYTHGASNVMRFFAQLRRDEADGLPAGARQRSEATPTARHVAALFLRCPDDLTTVERTYLARLHRVDDVVARLRPNANIRDDGARARRRALGRLVRRSRRQ